MTNFKIGQKVICITKDVWTVQGVPTSGGPKYNQELIIDSISYTGYLGFKEFGFDSFESDGFAPTDTMKESEKYAEELLKVVAIEINEENLISI